MLPWLLSDMEPKVVWMPHCLRECLGFSGTERHPEPREPGTLTWKTYVTCLSRQLVQAICTLHSGLTTRISFIYLTVYCCLFLIFFFFFWHFDIPSHCFFFFFLHAWEGCQSIIYVWVVTIFWVSNWFLVWIDSLGILTSLSSTYDKKLKMLLKDAL